MEVGDTIILEGIREFSNDQEHCYEDQNNVDLRGRKLLLVEPVEFCEDGNDYTVIVKCNNCDSGKCGNCDGDRTVHSPHVLYFTEDDMSSVYITAFTDETDIFVKNEELLR